MFVREGFEADSEFAEVESGDFFVELLGQHVDTEREVVVAEAQLGGVPQCDLSEHLVGEAIGHDEAGVSGGTAEVDQSSFGEHDHGVSVGEDELVDLRLDGDPFDAIAVDQEGEVDFRIEVSDVADDGFVLHLLEVGTGDDSTAACGGDEDVALRGHIIHRRHFVAFHRRLQCTDRVDFGNDHSCSEALHGMGTSFADVAVATDDDDLSGDHDVGGSFDPIRE